MAKFDAIGGPAAAFKPYLEPGEQLRNVAYGVKQPHVLVIALTGPIGAAIWTKEYLVALTDRRIIALRFKGSKVEVQEVLEYRLNSLPQAKTSTGAIFTHIKITDPAKPFVVKFHRMGPAPQNRENAMAIAAALSGKAA